MKTRFSTLDIISILEELQQYVGMRVNQVYDIDNKTYLIKLNQPEKKAVLLIESGTRIHTTEFEWPKNPAPSGFSMKLRKHINNKRLEYIKQCGVDRVLDLQFGSGDAAYHLILEMYDRGNLVLTDWEFKILNILRPRVAGEEKFLVRETYPLELCKQEFNVLDEATLNEYLSKAKETDTLKKVLMPHFDYGPNLLEHILLAAGFAQNTKIKDFNLENVSKLNEVLNGASKFLTEEQRYGVIIQKVETRPVVDGKEEEFFTYVEFHPYFYKQYKDKHIVEFDTFNTACDQFFSKVEAQKIELKTVHQEKAAVKKLENVKKDHENRIKSLQEIQDLDRKKGEFIEMNSDIVNNGIQVVNSAIANQIPWDQIKEIIKEATDNGDPVASRIKQIKLEVNHIVMQLIDPFAHLNQDYEDDSDESEKNSPPSELLVEIDLDLTAQANARKYFVQKKTAAVKERKTVESGSVALKSAEKKTKQHLKEMSKIATINKARKVYWFEKFFWFISSENILVIGGKDAQQNELLVKRYMKPNDVYVHADLHGASTVVVKNPTSGPVPPKTLNEAGQFAVCFSAAWDSKVLTAAYWVTPDQVSKTAPSGEYLTVGSFMIRGKKNFLPPSHLTMGFGFMFKLEDDSVERHKGDRKIRGLEEAMEVAKAEIESVTESLDEVEIDVEGGESSDEEQEEVKLDAIDEQNEPETEDNEEVVTEERESSVVSERESEVSAKESEEEKEDGSEEKALTEFPDTDVKIGFDRLGSVEIKTRSVSVSEEPVLVAPGNKSNKKDKKKGGGNPGPKEIKQEEPKKSENVRGKKGKLKKIKEKYKDQDDEERELRMQILQSQGKEKESKNKKNKRGLEQLYGKTKSTAPKEKRPPPKPKTEIIDGEEVVVEEEKVAVNDETDMLDSLTGVPVAEDELLFAVPVCGPYNTLLNYKYKVKLTPGNGKRGKSCKTALAMFLGDKNTIQREKDLLKSVKDQDLARNLPGKVKLSAPHLQKVKGKK
eukprot:TRINITY_DN3980_c0_g1_i1.p1 TRINITY_DN3980_c0_g1~~TRINITY_DN3980_c0_g1_i1.p1  ORF type:complete len:997 (-),score=375.72 TRINITY_DN3980_c0_g1_i1:115-3105(-)